MMALGLAHSNIIRDGRFESCKKNKVGGCLIINVCVCIYIPPSKRKMVSRQFFSSLRQRHINNSVFLLRRINLENAQKTN